jgi:3-oxoadipate enol-lactonase
MSSIEVDYRVEGTGPPLYMVHGIGSRKVTWNVLVKDLKKFFTCVTYDLRGHGDSPIPELPYSLDDLVDDLEALRAKLGHDKINVIGHSLGGMIGPAYARRYPSNTLTVTLLSTAAGRSVEDQAKLAAVANAMHEKGVVPVISTLVERWYTDEFIAEQPDLIQMRIKQVEDTPADVFKEVFRIYATTEMLPWLDEVNCPCLVLTGELDGGCNPRLNQLIHKTLPDSQLVLLDAVKHSILIECPERVLPEVKSFLLTNKEQTSRHA